MIIHQSDLQSMQRCGEQHRRQLNGERGKQLSATAYGSVLHHALHTLERERDLPLAISTFEHYWHPLNIDAICEPVEEWIAKQSFGGLARQGVELLKRYWDLKQYDETDEVLALEIPFVIPIGDTGHELAGTIDRLTVRPFRRRQSVCVDDWKSGKKKTYLKHNVQHIAYAYATTRPEFWLGNPAHHTEGFGEYGAELMAKYERYPRHGFWIDCSGTTPKWNDCGAKTQQDYDRFFHAVDTYVRARENNVFMLNIAGEVCEFCPFRETCPEGITYQETSMKKTSP